MSRLIDADALLKEANKDGAYGYVDAKQIDEAPTIDAVPVVRCKDCQWRGDDEYCDKYGFYVCSDEFFCKGGQRESET